MAENSAISWTKSTFNPWIGCTKVGPGCDGCYAAALDHRMQFGGAEHWGPGVPRHRTTVQNWNKLFKWNREAPDTEFAGRRGFWPVFCASLGDVFDNEVPAEWRMDLFALILETPNLEWLLVTKRISNVPKMVADIMWPRLPNVRLLITVVNQEEADRDIPKLLAIPCKNGISYEPAIGPVDWWPWLYPICDCGSIPVDHNYAAAPCPRCAGRGCNGADRLDWIIIGGESSQPGHTTRPFNVEWARSTIEQCRTSKVPVFVKQLGSNPVFPLPGNIIRSITVDCQGVHDRAGANPAEWPEDLRIQEFPA